MRKPIRVLIVVILLLSLISLIGSGHDLAFNRNVNIMTPEEILSELRVAEAITVEGGYYPESRINELNSGLQTHQKELLDQYGEKLKREYELMQEYDRQVQAIQDELKKRGEQWYEDNKEELQQRAYNSIKSNLNITSEEEAEVKYQIARWGHIYDENIKGYAETAQKIYGYYNAYENARKEFEEAPETAQNLLGSLALMEKGLNDIAGKLEKTLVGKPVAEIFKFYAEATSVGRVAAENATKAVHKGGIIDLYETQYRQGLEKYYAESGTDAMDFERSSLMNVNGDLKILRGEGDRYVVFDKDFNYLGYADANEYKKMEMVYALFERARNANTYNQVGIDSKWGDLTAEQLLKLSKGETVELVERGRWIRWGSDSTKEVSAQDLDSALNDILSLDARNHSKEAIYDSLYGDEESGFINRVGSWWSGDTESNRKAEIEEAYREYIEYILEADRYYCKEQFRFYDESHHLEQFLQLALENKQKGKTVRDLIEQLKSMRIQNVEDDEVPVHNQEPENAFVDSSSMKEFLDGLTNEVAEYLRELLHEWTALSDSVEFYPLQGMVFDDETKEPIEGAFITVFRESGSASETVRSGPDGSFNVGSYLLGEILTVKTSAKGYFPSTRGGSLKNAETRVINFLKPDEEEEEDSSIRNSLVILIDVSGSMAGSKIENARRSAISTIDSLEKTDEVAVITFSGCENPPSVLIPFTKATQSNKASMQGTIETIGAGGSTAIAVATAFAGRYLRSNASGVSRNLIVLSDGEETCDGDPISAARNLN